MKPSRREQFREHLQVIDRKLKTSWAPVVPGTLFIDGVMAFDHDVDWATGEIKKPGVLPGAWLEYQGEIVS